MKIYILILMFTAYNKGGITTAEFNSYSTCESAGIAFVTKYDGKLQNASYLCVEK